MSQLLERFQAKGRRSKTADPELIQRWEWDARRYGDKNIKIEIAKAKRTATSLTKSISQFSNLKASHEQSIKAAASAMRELASELETLAGWARDYHAFCLSEWAQEEAEEIKAFALARWGDSQAAIAFEADLICELGTEDGRLAFATWCHSLGKHTDCALGEISPPVTYLKNAPTQKEALVKTIQEEMVHRSPNRWNGLRGPTVICSWNEYEAYLSYRKNVAAQTTHFLLNVGSHG